MDEEAKKSALVFVAFWFTQRFVEACLNAVWLDNNYGKIVTLCWICLWAIFTFQLFVKNMNRENLSSINHCM